MKKHIYTVCLLLCFSFLHNPAHAMGYDTTELNELLIEATKACDYDLVKKILQNNAINVNATPFCGGDTALHEAVYRHSNDIAKLLIEYGADPLQPNDPGITALDATRLTGNTALLEFFAQHINNIEHQNVPKKFGKRRADLDMPPAKRKPFRLHN